MSAQSQTRHKTVKDIAAAKGGDPLVCLTAYDAPTAALLDPHCDLLLVGDSVGMVVHGLPSTVGVTLEMMILHGQAVMRGAKQAFVVVVGLLHDAVPHHLDFWMFQSTALHDRAGT